jgi:ribosomal protein L11 methyltransferase
VLAALTEIVPEGFEQIDGERFVEFAVYGAPGELPELPRGRAQLGGIPVEVSGTEVGDDWATRWREFHQPVRVGDFQLRAPWHEPGEGIDTVIDPGQAFGTGAHPTTRMCLELLVELPARGPLADLGCGSGVLAIAAAKLGFSPVSAFDNEVAAIEATLANARANGVTLDRVERHDLRAEPAPVADVTVANLVRPLLLEVAALLPEQPETLIVSGLLEGVVLGVAGASPPWRHPRRLRLQGWSALLLTRP